MSTYRREHYLAKLRPFYNDSGLIKVITGIRRCGKSSLLITVLNELFEQGIPETNLIYLNLDRREYRNVTTPDQLDQLIEQAMSNAYGAGLRYLFIDEVQNVKASKPSSTAGGRKVIAPFSSLAQIPICCPESLPRNLPAAISSWKCSPFPFRNTSACGIS